MVCAVSQPLALSFFLLRLQGGTSADAVASAAAADEEEQRLFDALEYACSSFSQQAGYLAPRVVRVAVLRRTKTGAGAGVATRDFNLMSIDSAASPKSGSAAGSAGAARSPSAASPSAASEAAAAAAASPSNSEST